MYSPSGILIWYLASRGYVDTILTLIFAICATSSPEMDAVISYIRRKPTISHIKIAGVNEFVNYIDEGGTELYLLRPEEDEKTPLLSEKPVERKGKIKKLMRKLSNFVENIKNWIKCKCPKLLRPV